MIVAYVKKKYLVRWIYIHSMLIPSVRIFVIADAYIRNISHIIYLLSNYRLFGKFKVEKLFLNVLRNLQLESSKTFNIYGMPVTVQLCS